MKKNMLNTNKEFYLAWSKDELIKEVCRLNAVLIGAAEDAKKVRKNFEEILSSIKES